MKTATLVLSIPFFMFIGNAHAAFVCQQATADNYPYRHVFKLENQDANEGALAISGPEENRSIKMFRNEFSGKDFWYSGTLDEAGFPYYSISISDSRKTANLVKSAEGRTVRAIELFCGE